MKKLLPYISLLGIAFFVFVLFPFGRDLFADLLAEAGEKKTHLTEEYDRIKDVVAGVNETLEETENKINKTLETVNETKAAIEETTEKMTEFYDTSKAKMEALSDLANPENWRQSDPAEDISIAAGRTNYNFANPGADGLSMEHLEMDLKPWIEWGSSEGDKTSKEDRIKVLSTTDYGKKVLEKLGYKW